MGKNLYVYNEVGGGIDWHDYSRHYEQMKYDGDYKIPTDKLNDILFEHMSSIVLLPDKYKDSLYEALKNKKEFSCPIYADEEAKANDDFGPAEYDYQGNMVSEAWINLKFEKESIVFYFNYCFGQYYGEAFYHPYEIDEGDELYTVIQEFACPFKGCPNFDRMLHMPFDKLEDAEKYLSIMNEKHKNFSENVYPKRYMVLKVGKTDWVKGNVWYNENLTALNMMYELGIDETNPEFLISTLGHIEKMQPTYDTLISGRKEMLKATCIATTNTIPTLSIGDVVWTEGLHIDELNVRYVKIYADESRNKLLGWINEDYIQYC